MEENMLGCEFSFAIVEKISVIAEGSKGWNLELNLVSWGGRPAKYDIRQWSLEHDKMGKGVTFTKEELLSLKNVLNSISFDEGEN